MRSDEQQQQPTENASSRPRAANRRAGTPLLALDIHEKSVKRCTRVEKFQIHELEVFETGARVTAGDRFHDVLVSVWLWVVDGELRVRVPFPEVYERMPELNRIFAIDLLPKLMHAGPQGAMLMPLGSGAICRPADKPRTRDDFLIYLEQERWEMAPLLPVCAAWDPQHGGWCAVATEGDCDAHCRVFTDGQGSGHIGFGTSLRRKWHDPVDVVNREIRIAPIPAEADPVIFAAKRLRRHFVQERAVPTVHDRIARSPEVAYAAESYVLKMSYAQENAGLEMASRDKSHPVTFFNQMTFAEGRAALKRLKDAGLNKVETQAVGWNARGHDGMYPTRFPIDERLGGEAGFRETIRFGKELGYHMSVHDNFMMNCRRSPHWDPECITQDETGEPLLHGWWSGGIEYQSWGLALPYERLEGHLQRMKTLGLNGMYYCDYMMQPLEVNHHPRHRGPRSGCAAGQIRIWQACRDAFGAVATEFAPAPAAMHCDFVCYASGRKLDPEWPAGNLIDERVELWPLVFKGLTLKERTGHHWKTAMTAVLYGEIPRTQFGYRVGRPGLNVLDEAMIASILAVDELTNQRFGRLRTQAMTSWRRLDAAAAHLPGWLFVLSGLAVLAMAAVMPAHRATERLAWQAELMRTQAQRLAEQERGYLDLLEGLRAADPVLVERLALTQLHLRPVGTRLLAELPGFADAPDPAGPTDTGPGPVRRARADSGLSPGPAADASIDRWVHQPLPRIGRDLPPYRPLNTRLNRLTTGPTRYALVLVGALCLVGGLVYAPGSPDRRPR